jgi:hypothetical protein
MIRLSTELPLESVRNHSDTRTEKYALLAVRVDSSGRMLLGPCVEALVLRVAREVAAL